MQQLCTIDNFLPTGANLDFYLAIHAKRLWLIPLNFVKLSHLNFDTNTCTNLFSFSMYNCVTINHDWLKHITKRVYSFIFWNKAFQRVSIEIKRQSMKYEINLEAIFDRNRYRIQFIDNPSSLSAFCSRTCFYKFLSNVNKNIISKAGIIGWLSINHP